MKADHVAIIYFAGLALLFVLACDLSAPRHQEDQTLVLSAFFVWFTLPVIYGLVKSFSERAMKTTMVVLLCLFCLAVSACAERDPDRDPVLRQGDGEASDFGDQFG